MRATQNVAFDSATSFALFDDAAHRTLRAHQCADRRLRHCLASLVDQNPSERTRRQVANHSFD
jgi:hypothetical protein